MNTGHEEGHGVGQRIPVTRKGREPGGAVTGGAQGRYKKSTPLIKWVRRTEFDNIQMSLTFTLNVIIVRDAVTQRGRCWSNS